MTDNAARALIEWPMRRVPITSRVSATPGRHLGIGVANISELQREYVNDVLRNNRLSYGDYTRRFEGEFARLHDRRFAIFCNSGTSALQVALHALMERDGWQEGDEVLVPAITFVATVNVVLQNRLRPVFVDVEPDCFGMDPMDIERHITSRTRAIMPVHLFGQQCDMEPIVQMAKHYRLRVLEDSCETMFVRHKGRPPGAWGEASCFSTYVAHLIVTGVGGLALADDEDLATLMKSLMNHGRDNIYLSIDDNHPDDPDRLKAVVSRRFSFEHVGYSYRATELEAALGLGELERHEHMLRRRRENAEYLTDRLVPLDRFLQLPVRRSLTEHAYMYYPIVVREGVDRDDLMFALEGDGIETRHMMPVLNQPVYLKLFGDLQPSYPVAAMLNERGLLVGCHQGFDTDDLDYMAESFYRYF